MATNNSDNFSKPISVTQGGTGLSTNTAYTVICSGTTSTGALQNVSGVGTSTQQLTSQGASTLPHWATKVAGNLTTPGTTTNLAIATWNGTGGATLFDNPKVQISSGSMMTNTGQSAFAAYLSASTSNNVTGDGTNYTVLCDTKIFDQNTDYTTGSGTFTAPVTGRYCFGLGITGQNLQSADSPYQLIITTTSRVFNSTYNLGGTLRSSGTLLYTSQTLALMTAADTCTFHIVVAGGSKVVGITGGASPHYTYCFGYLVC